jgi:hypothetical protein
MIFSPGVGAVLAKTFEHIGNGDIKLASTVIYSHPIYQSTNPEVRGSFPYAMACAGGGNCQDLLSGTMNPSDIVSYSLAASGTWGKWVPTLFYLGSSQWVYHPNDDAQVDLGNGQKVDVGEPAGFSRTSVRQTSYFSASVAYNVNPWLSPEIGYSLYRASVVNESGSYGNPLFDRNQDMRVYIGASVYIDELAQQLQGGRAEQKSGVRADSGRKPIQFY